MTGRFGAAAPGWAGRIPAEMAAVVALAGYTAWSYLSVTWAEVPAVAVRGSNRALVYLVIFAVAALLPWRRRGALALIAVMVLIVTALGLLTLIRLMIAGDPSGMFEGPLLASPLGYHNATAALWTMGAVPLLVAASLPDVPALLRGLLLGACGLLADLAILTQSRGWLLTLPIVLAVVLVLFPYRLRLVLTMATVTAVTLFILSGLLGVYRTGAASVVPAAPGALRDPVAHAGRISVVACLVLVGAGITGSLVETRTRARLGGIGGGRQLMIPALIVAIALSGILAGSTGRHRIGDLGSVWRRFQNYQPAIGNDVGSRYGSVDGARYDIWWVSLVVVRHHPLKGIGQDNFAQAYLRTRRSPYETQQWTHSLWLRLLVHTGMIGFMLFALFLGSALHAVARAWRRGDPDGKAIVAAAVVPLTVWLVHGSIDRFWEVPVLSYLALGGLGLVVSLGHDTARGSPAPATEDKRPDLCPGGAPAVPGGTLGCS